MGIRWTLLIGGVVVGFGALLFHLYGLQISKGQFYLARASSEVEAGGMLEAPRGVVYFTDKNGNRTPVALNKEFPVIYAVPSALADADDAVQRIAPLVTLPAGTLAKRLGAAKSSYALIQKKAPADTASAVEALGIKGIYIQDSPFRYYPLKTVGAQLLGFVGPSSEDVNDHGRYGIEAYYDETLAGSPGVLKDGKVEFPKQGDDLTLTIDPNIQVEAERTLAALVSRYGAPGGSIMVEDPLTGKILALANAPGFDPNEYQKAPLEAFTNPATQEIYEPGSVIKVITMAAALDAGKVTPSTTYYDDGALEINGHTIHNWDLKAYGNTTMTGVIEHSLNLGAAFAERQLGHESFKGYIKKFGFGAPTGVDLPGELSGDLSQLMRADAPEIEYATASFGQGMAVTPLQVLNAISAIANGGTLMRPYVNAALGPKAVRRVVSEEAARKVAQMMTTAVQTNHVAIINGYNVAGKTGTAQLPDLKSGGYTDKVVNTYIGFAPVSAPRFTVLVKLNQPPGSPLAGQTVVPAFRDIVQFLLNYYELPPDDADGSHVVKFR